MQGIYNIWFLIIAFSFGCRHVLASLHFNENLQREPQISKSGTGYVKVCYPKYKLGEEVVRDVKTPPTYGMYDYVWVYKPVYKPLVLRNNIAKNPIKGGNHMSIHKKW